MVRWFETRPLCSMIPSLFLRVALLQTAKAVVVAFDPLEVVSAQVDEVEDGNTHVKDR